ncbi:hypothetical protein BGZ70_009631 [Mortierella alpina]|uniref:Secreted protein n=1 Tax=Mortierella alpina TaxID=64518 RepID=A0A9P6J0W5_MORAP|nr:hypothetical protein BGZ70_009631 [Mortierella alpina]
MIFSTLAKATLAIAGTLLLTQSVESHSYVDCVDWRFKQASKNPKDISWHDKNGECFGYARRFPVGAKPFAKLDSYSRNRHYQQRHTKDKLSLNELACSNGKVGEEPGQDETVSNPVDDAYTGKDEKKFPYGRMTVKNVGDTLCMRWPAKNHAVDDEDENFVTIGIMKYDGKKIYSQKDYLNKGENKPVQNVKVPYKNCSDKGRDTDIWPCGACFKLNENIVPGDYSGQWRWRLNSNEWYTSCFDIRVKAKGDNATEPVVPPKKEDPKEQPKEDSKEKPKKKCKKGRKGKKCREAQKKEENESN